jgi:hypothetical protein
VGARIMSPSFRVAFFALGSWCSLLVACDAPPDAPPPRARCERAVANVAELRSERETRVVLQPAHREERARKLARALGDAYLAACEAAPSATVDCLIGARSADELDRCPTIALLGRAEVSR